MKRAIVKTVTKGGKVGSVRFILENIIGTSVAQSIQTWETTQQCVDFLTMNFPDHIIIDGTTKDYELVED